jgi:hypothetical protein
LAGETEVLGENLPQCHFVHHKPHVVCPDANPGRRGGKPATNRLRYGTAMKSSNFLNVARRQSIKISEEYIASIFRVEE